jgi:hypothetical protein
MNQNEQILLLAEIKSFLDPAHIRYWLRGGWGLDFALGEISRDHEDIDMVTWKTHRLKLERLFGENGFKAARRVATQTDFERNGLEVQVVFVVQASTGALMVAGFEQGIPLYLSRDVLMEKPSRLHNVSCRRVSTEGLIREKEVAPQWLKRPQRPKDIADLVLLRRLLEAESGPRNYG